MAKSNAAKSVQSQPTKGTQSGPTRRKRNAAQRKCLSRGNKIFFSGFGRQVFKLLIAAEKEAKLVTIKKEG